MSDIVNLILLIIALIVTIKTCKNVEHIIKNVNTKVFDMQRELTQLKARHAEMSLELAGQLVSIKILMGKLEAKIITELVRSYIDYDDIYKLILTDEVFISFKNITYPSESFLHEGIARLEKDGYKCELANGNLDIKNNLIGDNVKLHIFVIKREGE